VKFTLSHSTCSLTHVLQLFDFFKIENRVKNKWNARSSTYVRPSHSTAGYRLTHRHQVAVATGQDGGSPPLFLPFGRWRWPTSSLLACSPRKITLTFKKWRTRVEGRNKLGNLLLRSTTEMRSAVHVEIPWKFVGNFVRLLSFELTTTLIRFNINHINN